METTAINARTARHYWDLVNKNDDDAEAVKTETPNDDLDDTYEEEWWEKEYMSRPMKPYTMEEIEARLAQSAKDYAEGRFQDAFEAFAELKAELDREDALEAAMEMNQELAEAV